ncbi:MAG: hypothetical protein OER85_00400 [Gammaproteobacteria bacterium]|nr:hypothetical protein [Gammaproteobacteria bacterium]
MNKRRSPAWGRTSLFLSALFLSQVFLSAAFARSDGSILSDQRCTDCHTNGATTVMILGPDQAEALGKNTYTLEISGAGPGIVGGLNVAAPDGGVLSLIDAATQLTSGEITHTAPKAFASGTVSWDFEWTAPATPGTYELFGQGVNANNANGSNFDFAGVVAPAFTVTVGVIPIPPAAILFGSALGVLGWVRRRVT